MIGAADGWRVAPVGGFACRGDAVADGRFRSCGLTRRQLVASGSRSRSEWPPGPRGILAITCFGGGEDQQWTRCSRAVGREQGRPSPRASALGRRMRRSLAGCCWCRWPWLDSPAKGRCQPCCLACSLSTPRGQSAPSQATAGSSSGMHLGCSPVWGASPSAGSWAVGYGHGGLLPRSEGTPNQSLQRTPHH
jgi:hypothetical protein